MLESRKYVLSCWIVYSVFLAVCTTGFVNWVVNAQQCFSCIWYYWTQDYTMYTALCSAVKFNLGVLVVWTIFQTKTLQSLWLIITIALEFIMNTNFAKNKSALWERISPHCAKLNQTRPSRIVGQSPMICSLPLLVWPTAVGSAPPHLC